jgi:hypothetical protein
MSIASELTNLEGNIEDSYDAVNDMGGIVPAQRNMDNLDQAIRTIPQSAGTTYTAGNGIDIDSNNEISVDTAVVATQTDLATKQDALTAGIGINIGFNNVISLDPDLQVKELVYEYSQTATSSSTVEVDIPIDFETYEAYYFDVVGVGSGGSREWGTVQALDGSKTNLGTEQYGVEQDGSATLNGIARNYSQICACGWQQNQLTYIELTLRAVNANNYPWPCFKVMAQGAGLNQIFQGSVTTSSANVKYIRVNLVKPTGDGFTKVHAYATRRRS